MRFIDFVHFVRQIFFPSRNEKTKRADDEARREIQDEEPSRLELIAERVVRKLRSGEFIGSCVSISLHLLLILIFSLLLLPIPEKWEGIDLLGFMPPKSESKDIAIQPGTAETEEQPQHADAPKDPVKETIVEKEPQPIPMDNPLDPAPEDDFVDLPGNIPVGGNRAKELGLFVSGGGYEGRTREGRGRSVGIGDCSSRGEHAVEAALAWLAAHQIKTGDLRGSWSFDFEESCKQCSNGGAHGSRTAATALALLAFLGAGYTHEGGPENPYKNVVEDGLAFLLVRARETGRGCDLQQATDRMYSQGIATMCLCEAYAMSKRKPRRLSFVAQEAIRFIEEAQDRYTGGWRYNPNESPGDLSVTAWQVMSLKSAKLGGLHVSQPTVYAAYEFLDLVQTDGGRQYHYLPQDMRPGVHGIGEDSETNCNVTGLLLRMYLGWKPGDKMLDEGLDVVALKGPLKHDGKSCNLYFAYYATLALHHYGGSHWPRWNRKVREFLIETQSKNGHEAGSWFFEDHYCDKGGRLLNTVLATLVLETPYRIMPLFRSP